MDMLRIVLIIGGLSFSVSVFGQKIAEIRVDVKGESFGGGIPVKINLDSLTFAVEDSLQLYEIKEGHRNRVSFQVYENEGRELYWQLSDKDSGEDLRIFELWEEAPVRRVKPVLKAVDDGESLTYRLKGNPLLTYRYALLYPPRGVDTVFKRGGFIHPLRTIKGQVLTRIQPSDHYHHYGLWNPWTKVEYRGEIIDFWNLQKKEGTVRFGGLVSKTEGNIFGEYQTLHEHVRFDRGGKEENILNELQTVRVYKPLASQDHYLIDFTMEYNNATAHPVVLKEYRYGGLTMRATEKWVKENSEIITSEGLDRNASDASRAKWLLIQGEADKAWAGVAMLSHPANYNHPEPLRVWPEEANGNGEIMANFSPTKDRDWVLMPKQKYVLRYRVAVFDNKLGAQEVEHFWRAYSRPLRIEVERYD